MARAARSSSGTCIIADMYSACSCTNVVLGFGADVQREQQPLDCGLDHRDVIRIVSEVDSDDEVWIVELWFLLVELARFALDIPDFQAVQVEAHVSF